MRKEAPTMKTMLKRLTALALAVMLLAAMPAFAAAEEKNYTVDDGKVTAGIHDVELVPQLDLVCNGREQDLFKKATAKDGTLWYLVSSENLWKQLPLEESEDWTTEAPTAKDAGDYYVLVYIESTLEGCPDSGSQQLPMACFRITVAPRGTLK